MASDKPSQDHVRDLIDKYFQVQSGELQIGQLPISGVVAQHGAPLFVYDEAALRRNWAALRRVLPDEVKVFYSIKANPHQRLLHFFLAQGCGLEVASGGELHQALAAGCPPRMIVFAGPGKTQDELEQAVNCGVGEVHVESFREIQRLSVIAENAARRQDIALRINPAGDAQGGAMRMGGKSAPFGVDEEQIDDALEQIQAAGRLNLVGVHLFSGTQILDCGVLRAQYARALQISEYVARRIARPLQTIDLGGGLGIPYFPHEKALDLADLGRVLTEVGVHLKQHPLLAAARLILEPGRLLVGEAGIYVARVNDIKRSRGKTFVITDGGLHHHLAASGNLGQTIKRNFPVCLLNRLDEPAAETVDVVGPLCTPLDVLARDVALPRPEVGDLFGVFQSGAYARSASPLGFLSHPAPPEVWIAQGVASLIRRRGVHDDALRDQCLAEAPSSGEPFAAACGSREGSLK